MAPMGTKNAHAQTARTVCVMRMLSDMRRSDLKASSIPALPVAGLASKLEHEALAGIAVSSNAPSRVCDALIAISTVQKSGGDGVKCL
jgi:hypothetical protein